MFNFRLHSWLLASTMPSYSMFKERAICSEYFHNFPKWQNFYRYCRDSNNGHTKSGLVTRTWFEYPDKMARFLGYLCNLGPSFLRTGPLCPVFGCCSVLYLDGIRHLDTLLPFQYWTSRVFGSPPYKLRNILNVEKFPTIFKKTNSLHDSFRCSETLSITYLHLSHLT